MGDLVYNVQRTLKFALWFQFLLRGKVGAFLRYYGGLLLVGGLVVAASLALTLRPALFPIPQFGPPWVVGIICAGTIALGYTIGRLVSEMAVFLLCMVAPACVVLVRDSGEYYVAPQRLEMRSAPSVDSFPGERAAKAGDWDVFKKAVIICSVLSGLSYGIMRLVIFLPQTNFFSRWSFRGLMVLAMAASSAVGLELLRLVTHFENSFPVPWNQHIVEELAEPGWPKTLVIWLWLNLAFLWVAYDLRLLPRLLRRVGYTWVSKRFSINDSYMVDRLLECIDTVHRRPRSRSSATEDPEAEPSPDSESRAETTDEAPESESPRSEHGRHRHRSRHRRGE